jgi:acrylyl-CoA reductase (NADPH)
MCPLGPRKAAWERLAKDLDHTKLAEMTSEIGLDEVLFTAPKILSGQLRGRTVVKIS